jgi:CHRD domain
MISRSHGHAVKLALGLTLLVLSTQVLAEEFQARLGRMPVDARNQASVTGLGEATADLDGDELVISGRFAGLQGPATAANLHMGVTVGVRGPAIHALEVTSAADGALRGTVRLGAAEIEALKAGRLYIQIDSEPATDGNLWGWLLDE